MPSGGHSRSGPAPSPTALRRDRKTDASWITLSDAPRTETAPEWPLSEPTARELEVWREWWSYPVAALWAADVDRFSIALTVRMFIEAEQPKARAEDRKSLRIMMADLYLTRAARDHARIKIVGDEETVESSATSAPEVDPDDPRARFQVVDGGRAG